MGSSALPIVVSIIHQPEELYQPVAIIWLISWVANRAMIQFNYVSNIVGHNGARKYQFFLAHCIPVLLFFMVSSSFTALGYLIEVYRSLGILLLYYESEVLDCSSFARVLSLSHLLWGILQVYFMVTKVEPSLSTSKYWYFDPAVPLIYCNGEGLVDYAYISPGRLVRYSSSAGYNVELL